MSNSDFSGNSDIEEIESTSWKLDLVSLLLDSNGCSTESLRQLCQKRPVPPEYRKDVWRICLQVQSLQNLPNESILAEDIEAAGGVTTQENDELHADCLEMLQAMEDDGNLDLLCAGDDKNRLLIDMENTVRRFIRTYHVDYVKSNGWLQMLRILLSLKLSQEELYAFFVAIQHRFIVSNLDKDNRAFDIFRLLLQYHEPQLCAHLDTAKISLNSLIMPWLSSLFATSVPYDVLASMWDIYFLMGEPFMVLTLILVIFVQAKDAILTDPGFHTEQEIKTSLERVCDALNVEDLEDFFVVAEHYLRLNTPNSFVSIFGPILFGNMVLENGALASTRSLVLPITLEEVLQSIQGNLDIEAGKNQIKLLLVDCRHADDYNAGHLHAAHYLDPDLLLRSPNEFQSSLKAILHVRVEGQHLCFMGVDTNDDMVTMVISQFLQRNVTQISLLQGGYHTLHESVGAACLDSLLDSHEPSHCLVCRVKYIETSGVSPENRRSSSRQGNQTKTREYHITATNSNDAIERELDRSNGSMLSSVTAAKMSSMFSRFSATVKTKSAIMKDKVVNYVKNEAILLQGDHIGGPGCAEMEGNIGGRIKSPVSGEGIARVESVSRQGSETRAYRNTANVFSIDDEEEDIEGSSDVIFNPRRMELVSLETWRKKPEIKHCFPCELIRRSNSSPDTSIAMTGHLLLSESRLFVLLDAASYPYRTVNAGSPPPEVIAKKGLAYVALRRPLKRLLKITSHRKIPELIGLHYGDGDNVTSEGEVVIQEKDRLLFPTGCAGEATKEIKLLAYQAATKADSQS